LNVTIPSAALTANATVKASRVGDRLLIHYQGDAMLGSLRMLDQVTAEPFLQCNSLTATHIDVAYGEARPAVSVGKIRLADFYARVMLNSDGRLNLNDIIRSSQTASTSLTREKSAASAGPLPSPVPQTSTTKGVNSTGVDIVIGRITAQDGHVNWTDNYIQPHYTADLTDIRGELGAFSSRSTAPADISVAAKINRSSPVEITGRTNPLIASPLRQYRREGSRRRAERIHPLFQQIYRLSDHQRYTEHQCPLSARS
jgi:hypothetical protein